jgi:RNA polymerase sigma-70 factor (ECF subfamily)
MPYLRSDRDLLLRFRRGEPAALERVYWAHVDRVVRVGRFGLRAASTGTRVPGVAHAHELPDLVQEVFARAFARPAREAYDGIRDYEPYLVRLAANLLIDRHRKLGREVVVEASRLEGQLDIAATEEESASWLDPALVRHAEAYVATLSVDLRAIYQQRFVQGLSQRDAAAAMGLTRPRLRTLEGHLRDGLEAWLDRNGCPRP